MEDKQKAFGLHKYYGVSTEDKKKVKSTNGKLMIEISPNNFKCAEGCYDKPFAILNMKKAQLIKSGINPNKLKVTYI